LQQGASTQYGAALEMSTPPLSTLERLTVSAFSAGGARIVAAEIRDDGTARYEDVPVFRSGTFRDSMGFQHTYEPEHMEQIVFNHGLLKGRGIFGSPPVREDHSVSIKNTIGYAEDLKASAGRTGQTFLLASFEVTEPEAVAKIERGTFRFRSAEIGYYETNDEALYWPVFMGFAFVDIPAVEGLDQYARSPEQHFSMFVPGRSDHKEPPMGTETPHQFSLKGVKTNDFAAVQARLDELEAIVAAPPKPAEPHAFRVGGSEVRDVAAVQQSIDRLETFRTETLKAARANFVKGLAAADVIKATDIEKFQAHVDKLSDEEFDSFKALYTDAEGNDLFARHDDGSTGGTPTPTDDTLSQAEIDQQVVADFKRAGMKPAEIAKTPAGQRLAAAAK
jgi:hypothetical protein